MPRRKTVFTAGHYYHVYNRGVSGEAIFREEANYLYLLHLTGTAIEEFDVSVIAYCLMPNHYHFLLRQDGKHSISNFMHSIFNAYTKAINKSYQRSGSLFEKPFKRKPVTKNRYFKALVAYIHQNPQRHGLIDDFRDWPFSSYQALISEKQTRLAREEILSWFDGSRGLVQYHEAVADFKAIADFIDDE